MPSFNGRQFSWQIESSDVPNSIKSFLQTKDFSRRGLANLRSRGQVLIDGREVELNHWLQNGEKLVIVFPEIISEFLHPVAEKLDICYEDDFLLVVNKPAGLLTIPSRREFSDSLAQRLLGYYQRSGISAAPHILTRLDKDTSGVVLIAKDRHTQYVMGKEKIVRVYHALVSGKPQQASFTIEQPIRKCEDSILKREVHPEGKFARTHAKLLKSNERYSLIELHLDTGRTHQIRVHMASIGYPLLGDVLYDGECLSEESAAQMLHAKQLRFIHPYDLKEVTVEAAYPLQFQFVLEQKLV